MATQTANYNLTKPDQTDTYNVADFNANMDIVDSQLKKAISTNIMAGAVDNADGAQGLVPAPTAGQQNQVLTGAGVFRDVVALLNAFVGATTSVNGKIGAVPAPTKGQENSILLGSGVWGSLADLAVASGFSVNAIANGGHLTLPVWLGGLTIEWGNTGANYYGGTVVFPKPFTTIFQVYAITGSARDENVCPNNISNTQFDIQTQGVSQGVCRWFAIGIA